MNEYKLYFGVPPGNPDLDRFLDREVNPRLESYTLTPGRGVWRGSKEDSLVMTVIGPPDLEPTLREIAGAYASYFDQEAVYLTASPLILAAMLPGKKKSYAAANPVHVSTPVLEVIQ